MRNCSNRVLWLAALATLASASAYGATIQNVVIVNSASPANPGGVFPDGSTYSGSVSLGTSQIGPGTGNVEFPLAAFNMVQGGAIHFDFGAFHGGLIFPAEEQIAGSANIFERSGSALLVDPAALAPEPPSSTLLYGALFLATLRAVILCARTHKLRSQTTKGRSSS